MALFGIYKQYTRSNFLYICTLSNLPGSERDDEGDTN